MQSIYHTLAYLLLTIAILLAISTKTVGQTPTASIIGPNSVLLGETTTLNLAVDNSHSEKIGFDPVIEFTLPALPDDGEEGAFPDSPTLALSLQEASYLGNPVYTEFVGHFDAITGELQNPLTGKIAYGQPNDALYLIHYPISSIAPDQPAPIISIKIKAHELAPIEAHNITATGIFNFGDTPVGNANPIYGNAVTTAITPGLLQIRKTVSYPESETATGPSFPGTWNLIGNVARAATLENVSFTDALPNNFYVSDISIIRPQGGELNLSGTNPGQTLYAKWDKVSGSSENQNNEILIQVSGYVPEHDGSGNLVLSQVTGENTSTNVFESSYEFERPGIDPEGGLNITATSNTIVLDTLSLAIQKGSTLVTDSLPKGLSPEDTVEFILNIQISDFKSVEKIAIINNALTAAGLASEGDILGDGLSFDTTFIPTYSVSIGSNTVSGNFNFDNYTQKPNPAGHIIGSSRVTFDLSQQLIDDDQFDADGILTGADLLNSANASGTTAQIRYRATIDTEFDSPESGDASIDITDWVDNYIDIAADDRIDQIKVGDESAESLQMQPLSILHKIERITTVEGLTIDQPNDTPFISPGDQVTFSIEFSIPTGDIEDLVVNDFLPYSMFNISDVNGDGSNGDTPQFTPSVKRYPAIGEISYGPGDEYSNSYPSYDSPNYSYSPTNNSFSLDYGDIDTPAISDSDNNGVYNFELRFTIVAGIDNLPDGFKMTNLVQLTHGSTNAGNTDRRSYSGLYYSKSMPIISKGVIAIDNPNATISPTPLAFFNNAGSIGNCVNALPGDTVRFAITLQNIGSDPISHLVLNDSLPNELDASQAKILSLTRADGTPLITTPFIDSRSGSADEYALFGTGLALDTTVSGNYLGSGTTNGAPYGDETLVLVLEAPIVENIAPNYEIANTATANVWYAASVPANGPYATVSDSATIRTETIQIQKNIAQNLYGDDASTTPIEINGETISRATIGEIVTYDIEIEIPQGVATNTVFTDSLPSGLEFVTVNGSLGKVLSIDNTISSTNLNSNSTDSNSPHITVSNQSITFDFGTITRAINSDKSPKTIRLRLYTYVSDITTNIRGVEIINNATLDWAGGSINASSTFTVTRPNISIEKSMSPLQGNTLQGGSPLLVEFTIENLGDELNTSTAHDMIIEDFVSSAYFDVSSIVEGSTPEDFAFSTVEEPDGTIVRYTTTNIQRDDTYYFSFTANLIPDIALPIELENTVTATGTSLPESPPSGTESIEIADDLVSARTAFPTVTKSTIATSEAHTSESPLYATIGEQIVYRLKVDLPEGVIPSLTLTDRVPNGMDFVGTNSSPLLAFPFKGYAISGPMGETMKSLLTNVVDPDPTPDSSTSLDGNSDDIKFQFDTIYNLPDGDSSNDYFYVDLELVVLDRAATIGYGSNTTKLKNRAQVQCDGMASSEGLSKNIKATAVEPFIAIDKKILEPSGEGGDRFTVQLTLENNGLSDAFEIVLEDPIPSSYFKTDEINFDPNGIVGWTMSLVPNGTNTTVKIISNPGISFIPGATLTFAFSVPVHDDIQAPFVITNTATVTQFTTLDDTLTHPNGILERTSGGATDSDTINIANAAINLSLVSTSENDTTEFNNLPALTFGERAVLRIDVDLPDGTISNPTFTLNLPNGLDFVGINNDPLLAYPGKGYSTFNGTFASLITSSFNGITDPDGTPNSSASNDGNGKDISFKFDTILNLPDENPDNDDFHFFIEVICVDDSTLSGYSEDTSKMPITMRMDEDSGFIGTPSTPLVLAVVEPKLDIYKTMALSDSKLTDRVNVSILLENTGNSPAHEIIINDMIDTTAFDINSIEVINTSEGFLFNADENLVVIKSQGQSLQPEASAEFSFSIKILPEAETPVLNTARVIESSSLNHANPQPTEIQERDGSVIEDTAVLDLPVLEAFMKVTDLNDNGAPLVSGSEVEYLITVTNTGSTPATSVQLTTGVPTNTTFIANTLIVNGESIDGSEPSLFLSLDTLEPGETKTATFRVKVDSTLPTEAKSIVNQAQVTFAERSTQVTTDNDPLGHDSTLDDGIDDLQDTGVLTHDDDPSTLPLLQGVVIKRSYLAFEDLKNRGWSDWDHNDIMLDVTSYFSTNDQNQVESVIVIYQILSRGAALEHTLNLRLPYQGNGSWKTSYVDQDGTVISSTNGNGVGEMNTQLYASTRQALPPYTEGRYDWGASRTERFDPTPAGKIAVVELTLSDPSSNPIETFSESPHDTWAHVVNTGEDIHRVKYKIGNTQTALEGPLQGRNLPLVVEFSEGFNWPAETKHIYNSHPNYINHIISGGSENLEWWKTFNPELIWVDADGNTPGESLSQATQISGTSQVLSAGANDSNETWSKSLGASILASPVLYDLTEDGHLEILIGSMDGNVSILDHNGDIVPGWPQMTAPGLVTSPNIGDIDDDGTVDVIIGATNGNIYAWDINGSLKDGFPINLEAPIKSVINLTDVNSDNVPEIIVHTGDSKLHVIDSAGTALPGFPKNLWGDKDLYNSWILGSSPMVFDLHGDGDLQIGLGTTDNTVYIFNADGTTAMHWPAITDDWNYPSITPVDLTDDNKTEVVIGSGDNNVYAWTADKELLPGFPVSLDGGIIGTLAAADLTGNGINDLVATTYAGSVYAIDAQGNILEGWPQKTEGPIIASPIIVDVDGDNALDIVAASRDNALHAWSAQGEPISRFNHKSNDWIESTPAVGDIDNDGKLELVYASHDQNIYIVELESNTDTLDNGWPSFLGGQAKVADTDTDNDGLNDAQEIAQFGTLDYNGQDDPDKDGISTHAEWIAGTDANDNTDRLHLTITHRQDPTTKKTAFTLTWPAKANRTYQLYTCDTISSNATWTQIETEIPLHPTEDHTMQYTLESGAHTFFFRIAVSSN